MGNHGGGGDADIENVQDHLLPSGESNRREGATMSELIWFTVGFVTVLVIITAADTIVRCSAK